MPILCKPAVSVPEHVVTLAQTLELCNTIHADHPQLELALRLLRNTGVQTRHFVRPLEETLSHPGLTERNRLYQEHSKLRVPPVIHEALSNASLGAEDIDAIVYVSCTGFLMPSMTAHLVNEMGFRSDTRQIPIAQLGCAAGGAAINQAFTFCTAFPDANVLIVACEFCSLCYQPTDKGVGNLLSNGLFGDAVAAAVVRARGGAGPRLERTASYLIPHTEDWICYEVKETGFHFRLDKRVPKTMEPLAPSMRALAQAHGMDASKLGFYIIHAGGPRILDDLALFLNVDRDRFRYSRATLTSYGNIASAVVFDALRRAFEDGEVREGATGMIAGFGPGITAEICVGHWAEDAFPAAA
ncbi:type III polyketide synthase [Chitinasiproducens palmae]|uniref:1,3,6,8-tetrahydroxynaphthalene synthase n=1 Tax=Chitinasiproducens palmae TaxID=1770053 RepID=A0A1H2PWG6_9BURK|nr:type III polyketide synthase [Chitinasiproducens palmae]SDV51696.1 1,3,6,8-tetrahydroxynaphthalene synthase [Chitinasiproducens palmae]